MLYYSRNVDSAVDNIYAILQQEGWQCWKEYLYYSTAGMMTVYAILQQELWHCCGEYLYYSTAGMMTVL